MRPSDTASSLSTRRLRSASGTVWRHQLRNADLSCASQASAQKSLRANTPSDRRRPEKKVSPAPSARPLPAQINFGCSTLPSQSMDAHPSHARAGTIAEGSAESISLPSPGAMMRAMVPTQHARLRAWVDEMAALCAPERVHWCDGSEAEFRQ